MINSSCCLCNHTTFTHHPDPGVAQKKGYEFHTPFYLNNIAASRINYILQSKILSIVYPVRTIRVYYLLIIFLTVYSDMSLTYQGAYADQEALKMPIV